MTPGLGAASNGVSGQFDPYGRIHAEIEPSQYVVIDTSVIKSLKFNSRITSVNFLLLLINSLFCIIVYFVRIRGVGLRFG